MIFFRKSPICLFQNHMQILRRTRLLWYVVDIMRICLPFNMYTKQSSVSLTVLIQSMCRTLLIMPTHKAEFIKLIEKVLVKFYEKILARYKCM